MGYGIDDYNGTDSMWGNQGMVQDFGDYNLSRDQMNSRY